MSRRTFHPLFWTLAQIGSRLRPKTPVSLDITVGHVPEPETVSVPTRHGPVRALVFRPSPRAGQKEVAASPVVMHMHGGGFINRYPEQDRYIARYLVANLDVIVVLPDYDTAPKVRYPVAEEEMFDVARWIQNSGQSQRWNGDQLLLSGVSAGAKLAINVCQQLHAIGATRPLAAALIVPVTDVSRTDRTSPTAKPAISPFVQRAVTWSYFPDVERRREALASPRFDDSLTEAMPATLIQTAALDTLAPEGADLADRLEAAGVDVTHHEHPEADHDFTTREPVERIRTMLTEIATLFDARLHHTDR